MSKTANDYTATTTRIIKKKISRSIVWTSNTLNIHVYSSKKKTTTTINMKIMAILDMKMTIKVTSVHISSSFSSGGMDIDDILYIFFFVLTSYNQSPPQKRT